MPRHADEAVVEVEVLPVEVRHPPARPPVPGQRPQARALLLAAQVEPELEDEGTLVRQHLLETEDLGHALVEVGAGRAPEDPVEDRLRVPRAEEDPERPLRGQRPPVAPHARPGALLVGRLPEGVGVDVAGIHPGVEEVHGLALAGTFHAPDDGDHGEAALLVELVLRVEKRRAQPGLLALVGPLVDDVLEIGRFEHGSRRRTQQRFEARRRRQPSTAARRAFGGEASRAAGRLGPPPIRRRPEPGTVAA